MYTVRSMYVLVLVHVHVTVALRAYARYLLCSYYYVGTFKGGGSRGSYVLLFFPLLSAINNFSWNGKHRARINRCFSGVLLSMTLM